LLSLNRFENKKNIGLAIDAFAKFKAQLSTQRPLRYSDNMRMVLAGERTSFKCIYYIFSYHSVSQGGYDPRLEDNVKTLVSLLDNVKSHGLTYHIVTPAISRVNIPPINTDVANPDILFLLNFTTSQRSALLIARSTIALLYTPTNEHFGIGPVEGMICGIPVLACNTGGPTETIVDAPALERTGWLRPPHAQVWADGLNEIVEMSESDRDALAVRSKARARKYFGMEAMASAMEDALKEAFSMGAVSDFSSFTWITLVTLLVLISTVLISRLIVY
jgi:alpha-1,3/alpha-1,6-mannosyltransferase